MAWRPVSLVLVCLWLSPVAARAAEPRPPAAPPARPDRYGDPLPADAVARLGTVRFRSTGKFALSPDGKVLALTTSRGVVLAQLPDGKPLRRLDHPGAGPLVFSPDSRRIATRAADIWLWDVRTGRRLGTVPGRESSWPAGTFTPDSRRFLSWAWGGGAAASLWDVETGRRVGTAGSASALGADGNGTLLAELLDASTERLREVATGKIN
jgi:WD40 repeat protein